MIIRPLPYLWACPNTLLGLVIAAAARLTGGAWAVHTGVVEAHGGAGRWLLRHATLLPGGASAITLGHVVLAQSEDLLHLTRTHERVHVRQYERWGPGFIPAYLGASAWLWLRGKDAYRDNPFEVEAYGVAGMSRDDRS